MARGWESKAVEDQIEAKNARAEASTQASLTREEVERRTRREGILLARAHTLNALHSVHDDRYRAQLEGALAYLDSQLAGL